MIDRIRLLEMTQKVRRELLAERTDDGHWIGRLASSSLSTATAISALSIVERQRRWQHPAGPTPYSDVAMSEAIVHGLRWLSRQQNADGGWGDTRLSHSNVATTMLSVAAFHLTGVPAESEGLLDRAERYLDEQGRIKGLKRRYGRDKTFAVPILTNCALAGTVPWRQVSPLPFELAALPPQLYRFLRLPVVSYAIPALVAIGQAGYHHRRPWNPLTHLIRHLATTPSLKVLERMQPESGGFLEAIPLTSFVVMSLASTGQVDHPVVERGVRFLMSTVREDGSWPIDSDLATWNTTLAINALGVDELEPDQASGCIRWLLDCQHRRVHPYTMAQPGGWGWSDLSGAVPDADDTAGALLALRKLSDARATSVEQRSAIQIAAQAGVEWLLQLQNRDGGWPTFCRGWGKLPFDRSGSDLTAHAMRALVAWPDAVGPMRRNQALRAGLRYLKRSQRADGTWIPLWFGNQDQADEANPVYGTAKVLRALHNLEQCDDPVVVQAQNALVGMQNLDGGWGGGLRQVELGEHAVRSSVEETALAVESLLPHSERPETRRAAERGLEWLLGEIEANRHREPTPIGFYFAKLWYYEDLYPLTFTVSALQSAVETWIPPSDRKLSLSSPNLANEGRQFGYGTRSHI